MSCPIGLKDFMLILADIGNTAMTYGTVLDGRIVSFKSVTHDNIPKIVKNWSNSGLNNKIQLVISCVVPQIEAKIAKIASKNPHLKLLVAGKNMPVSIRHKYHPAKSLGADRAVNLYGAIHQYHPPLLMIDFG